MFPKRGTDDDGVRRFMQNGTKITTFDMEVVIGVHNLTAKENSQRRHRVKRIVKHQQYKVWKSYTTDDIMLLQLETKIEYNEYASPICYDSTTFAPGTECVATGWGLTSHAGRQLFFARLCMLYSLGR